MRHSNIAGALLLLLLAVGLGATAAQAGVSAAEAARLKTDLTPTGAERAGNKDGMIPEWTGGLTTPTPGFKNGGRRPDPFANEKPLLQITSRNMDLYADKLSDGIKAMLKRYPDSFRLDVYRTHRSAAAPQYVYDNTLANATRAAVTDTGSGPVVKDAYGGYPFPIPRSGTEVMLNAQVRWRGESFSHASNNWQITPDGRPVLVSKVTVDSVAPYYFKDGSLDKFDGRYQVVRVNVQAPAIRAGEAVLGHLATDETKTASWTYLVGQRRVRKIPNACCDTPHPTGAGLMNFDEVEVFNGRLDRFDWKLVGKKELYIPYNANRIAVPTKDTDVLGPHHLNPDHVRWELHRVWVVEATLRPGQRHVSPRSRYYIDEDAWLPVLGDRWDANNQLSRVLISTPVALPDIPAQIGSTLVLQDLNAGSYFATELWNEQSAHYPTVSPRFKDAYFAPESLGGEGVR